MKKLTNKFRDSWKYFLLIFKREKVQTKEAIVILKKLLRGGDPTPEEIKFLKSQSLDLAKIVGIMGLGAVSMVIPIALEKILNKWDISIMPKDQSFENYSPSKNSTNELNAYTEPDANTPSKNTDNSNDSTP